MTSNADQLRREIEGTQRALSADVDALSEKVTPGRIAHRQVDRARDAVRTLRDKVMGTAAEGKHAAEDKARSMASSVSEGASSAVDTVADAPQAIRRGTEGSPLAAGLIAFSAGWLVSALLPASGAERRVAGRVADSARQAVEPLAERAGAVAQEVTENLREPVKEAVESVRSTASGAAGAVADEARSAAGEVRGSAERARSALQERTSSSY